MRGSRTSVGGCWREKIPDCALSQKRASCDHMCARECVYLWVRAPPQRGLASVPTVNEPQRKSAAAWFVDFNRLGEVNNHVYPFKESMTVSQQKSPKLPYSWGWQWVRECMFACEVCLCECLCVRVCVCVRCAYANVGMCARVWGVHVWMCVVCMCECG